MSSAPSPRLHSLPLLGSGKVRDNYAVGEDRLLMVTSDRLSAFDVIMAEPIPDKGRVLNTLALFWFDKLKHVVPNHLTGEAPESVVQPDEIPLVQGRSMLVKRLKPILVEAVVRGYLVGSGYKEYLAEGSVSGIALPPGIAQAERLDAPIFTPAAKAELGQHDENISFDEMVARIGADLAEQIRATSLTLYREASEYAATRGIIIADTKFEFGRDGDGRIILIDEVMTPDSSRFWAVDAYRPGQPQPSFDKQPLRDYLDVERKAGRWNGDAPPPPLPMSVVDATSKRYLEAYRRVTGSELKV